MARQNTITFLSTTRANLNTQAGASGLIAGEPYFISDESRIAVATSTSTYQTFNKQGEGAGSGWTSTVTATGTGASQNITLPESGLATKDVMVFVNGSRWETSEYSITGTTLTLTANASGDTIEVFKPAGATGATGASSSGGAGAAITGTPGTGSAALANPAKGVPDLRVLRKGQVGLFRWDDGSAWELRWGFFDGTNISRPTGGFVASSTGSALSLSSSAVVSLITGLGQWQRERGEAVSTLQSMFGSSTMSTFAGPVNSTGGTTASVTFADTNVFTREPQSQLTSATTANAQSGRVGAAWFCSRNSGFHYTSRFGFTGLPTGPRVTAGMTTSSSVLTADPSTLTDCVLFALDSTDTSFQFMTNDASGTCTKTDTGIALATGTLYEANVWAEPGGNVFGLLIDYSNSAIWYGSATTNLPTASTKLTYRMEGYLNGTNTGTACVLNTGNIYLRSGV